MTPIDLSNVSFLIVEPNLHMLSLIKAMIRGFGSSKIHDAGNAGDALEVLGGNSIDIVVLERLLPQIDGIELTRLLRGDKHHPFRYVPMIMLTSSANKRTVAEARDAGITEFLAKPVSARSLYSRISMVIEKPRPFIATASYFGPDRRRRDPASYQGPERRRERIEAAANFMAVD